MIMAIENENLYRKELIEKYRGKFDQLFRYIPWFEQKLGEKTTHTYQGDGSPSASMPIQVYDSTVLSFVKEMQATGLMDRNYVYVYSMNNLRTEQDELAFIDKAELKDMDAIVGILTRYVLGGMTRGDLWPEGVENGVYLHALLKMKELLEVWDEPLA